MLGDVDHLPLRDDVADGLPCAEVIEHLPGERLLMAELSWVARPGSRLLLSSPFVHGLHEQPFDFRRPTSVGLATSLEAAGWRVDSLCPVGGAVVVAVDGVVRWFDSVWRRACPRLVRHGSSAFRAVMAPVAALQSCLATLTPARERNFDPIDPMARFTAGPWLRGGFHSERSDRLLMCMFVPLSSASRPNDPGGLRPLDGSVTFGSAVPG